MTSSPSDTPADATASLVLRLRQGEAAAGAMLNDLYREALIRFCWGYLGRQDEAEDAVQDISYKVLTASTVPDALRPWLYKIARNHCFDLMRRRAKRADGGALQAASQIAESMTGHLTRLVERERRSQVVALVGTLPPEQQEVLRLRYVEGLSRAEAAEVLDRPESEVKSLLYRGVKFLRDHAVTSGDSL